MREQHEGRNKKMIMEIDAIILSCAYSYYNAATNPLLLYLNNNLIVVALVALLVSGLYTIKGGIYCMYIVGNFQGVQFS